MTGSPTELQRRRGALLWGGPHSALTGVTGLLVHGVRLSDQDAKHPDVQVAVPHSLQRKGGPFLLGEGQVVAHRTTRRLSSATGSLAVLPVARCVIDASLGQTSLTKVRGIVSAAVQQRRTTLQHLGDALRDAPQQGSGLVRQALEEVGDGAASAPEAALHRALQSFALTDYVLNAEIRDLQGHRIGVGDVVWEALRLVVEVDGQRWHLDPNSWVRDVERHTRMEAAGWTVLRYPASRVLADPHGVAAEIAAVVSRLMVRGA